MGKIGSLDQLSGSFPTGQVVSICLVGGQVSRAVADPGFPMGGCQPHGGVPTPEVAMFQKICMSKQKNLDPWGAHASGAPAGSANADSL